MRTIIPPPRVGGLQLYSPQLPLMAEMSWAQAVIDVRAAIARYRPIRKGPLKQRFDKVRLSVKQSFSASETVGR